MLNQIIKTEISDKINLLLSKGLSFACCSLPGENQLTFFIQYGDPVIFNDYKSVKEKSGFIITPFNNSETDYNILIEPDIIIEDNIQKWEEIYSLPDHIYLSDDNKMVSTTESEFIQNVKTIQNVINKGILKKAVISRVKVEKVEHILRNINKVFENVNQNYIDAFCYIYYTPFTGFWLGASPEALLSVDAHNYYTTAIAGTQYLNGDPLHKILWTNKELNEQDLVSRFIKKQLSILNINDYKIKGPYNVKAAQLVHLKTDFFFKQQNLNHDIGDLISKLHPTPSVCGYPSDIAKKLILKTEQHSRNYYTGLIGPLNYHNKSELFVNLRCMKVMEHELVLYAGAGITEGSVPDKEWIETGQKMETLKSVIKTINI